MPFDDRQRGSNARAKLEKYNEKNGNYSPSARYLYGGNNPQHQHQNQGGGGKHRDQHKRDSHAHHFDRLVKQNDIIIRLLKEIRDRLPAPQSSQSSHKKKKDSSSKAHRANHHEQPNAQAQAQQEAQSQPPELRIAANGEEQGTDQPVSLELEQDQE
ncbi:MAG: hypothetical protein GF331_15730 [Chitinivibrionales bacterium]|nr:hypothetical protein [Chitinivibrionales bacterium]